jgi:hypothetical protein
MQQGTCKFKMAKCSWNVIKSNINYNVWGGKGQDFFLWMLLYTLTKKIIKVQGNMLNAFGIILF